MGAMSRTDLEHALADVAAVADLRVRAMMGGWLVYAEGVLVGQFNGGELYIKRTEFGDGFAPELTRAPPYDGARPALFVPRGRFTDAAWLHELIAGTSAELRP